MHFVDSSYQSLSSNQAVSLCRCSKKAVTINEEPHVLSKCGSMLMKSESYWDSPPHACFNLSLPHCFSSAFFGFSAAALWEMTSRRTSGAPVGLRTEAGRELIGSWPPPRSTYVDASGRRDCPANYVHAGCVTAVRVKHLCNIQYC